MKKIIIVIVLGVTFVSCKNEKKTEEKSETKIEVTNVKTSKSNSISSEINWNEMPDLKDIGNFPFVVIPAELKINNEKDGFTNFFDSAKLENFTKNGIVSTNGKLGVLHFQDQKGFIYNQNLFEEIFYNYFKKLAQLSYIKIFYLKLIQKTKVN